MNLTPASQKQMPYFQLHPNRNASPGAMALGEQALPGMGGVISASRSRPAGLGVQTPQLPQMGGNTKSSFFQKGYGPAPLGNHLRSAMGFGSRPNGDLQMNRYRG